MTSQKLYSILKFLDDLDNQLRLQASLESIRDALNNLVNQPAQPNYQTNLATALAAFEDAAGKLRGITPSQWAAIESMGGVEFFDPSIARKVRTSIQTNAMTPSVARDFVKDLATRREAFLSTVEAARKNLENLGIKGDVLEAGDADLAFLIPRDIFDNQLGEFAKELNFINRLMQHVSEALTGQVEQVELEQLSSSVPTVVLVASVPAISYIATIVNKFLDAWKKIEEIRQMRAKLSAMGLKKRALDELTEQVETTVDQVVEEATELVLVNYTGSHERKNELGNAVRQDAHRLFGQIERGLTVEFRATPTKDKESEEGKALANIADLSRVLQFPQIAKEPLLLKNGEILEGDIQAVKQTKKTTTKKTTTLKKDAGKEEKAESEKES